MHKPLNAALESLEADIREAYPVEQEKSTLEVIATKSNKQEITNEDLNVIREKIKAARLEKLMARQLAGELSTQKIKMLNQPIPEESTSELKTDIPETAELFASNENLIKTIDETSDTLNDYIANLDVANSLNEEDDDDETMEAFGIIENQNKQIQLLEFLRKKEADQTLKLNDAVKQLEKITQNQTEALEKNRSELSELFEKTQELNEQIAFTKRENIELKETLIVAEQNTQSHHDELVKICNEYETLQEKQAQDNKRNLEQQAQTNECINALEAELRDAKSRIKALKREKNDMVQEIDANNKLVTLQDEMITALSMNDSETIKI